VWHIHFIHLIPALWRLSQEDHDFEDNLSDIVILSPEEKKKKRKGRKRTVMVN
jgi:hypothetical protein